MAYCICHICQGLFTFQSSKKGREAWIKKISNVQVILSHY